MVCNRPMLLFSGISGSTLKLIAILSMLIDHAGATIIRTLWQSPVISSSVSQSRLWSEIYKISRSVGRIAFPIFCFLIVEGFLHTRNVWRYARRLFLFSLISEIRFDLALKGKLVFSGKAECLLHLTHRSPRAHRLALFPGIIAPPSALAVAARTHRRDVHRLLDRHRLQLQGCVPDRSPLPAAP